MRGICEKPEWEGNEGEFEKPIKLGNEGGMRGISEKPNDDVLIKLWERVRDLQCKS